MKEHRREIQMINSGITSFEIPTGMKYAAIINQTDNIIQLYQKIVVEESPVDILMECAPYQSRTIPIRAGGGTNFSVRWEAGAIVGAKRATVLFSDENLNMNFQGGTAAGSNNVNLVGDSIGLVKANQLPAALSNNSVRVEVTNQVPVNVTGAVEITNDGGAPIPVNGTINANISNLLAVGAVNNAWNNIAVGAGGVSSAVNITNANTVSAYGNANAATTITLQVSFDGTTFYDSENVVLAGAGDFCINHQSGARYMRLKSSAAATITATISGKGG